jgi:hypothetical protein
MAYANHAEHITARLAERQMGRLLTFGHADLWMYDHPEVCASLYDSHIDGSGICYSSRLRPNLNMSPRYHSWLGGHGSGSINTMPIPISSIGSIIAASTTTSSPMRICTKRASSCFGTTG